MTNGSTVCGFCTVYVVPLNPNQWNYNEIPKYKSASLVSWSYCFKSLRFWNWAVNLQTNCPRRKSNRQEIIVNLAFIRWPSSWVRLNLAILRPRLPEDGKEMRQVENARRAEITGFAHEYTMLICDAAVAILDARVAATINRKHSKTQPFWT